MKKIGLIRRFHDEIGADCMNCDWQQFGAVRHAAAVHARDHGHRVFFTREETTVYDGRTGRDKL